MRERVDRDAFWIESGVQRVPEFDTAPEHGVADHCAALERCHFNIIARMRTVDVIRRKRDGKPLRQDEIEHFVTGVTNRTIPDYQAAALLMAIVLRGMGLEVLGISCITNPAAGVLPKPLVHDEVMEVASRVRAEFSALLEAIIERL